MDVYTDERIELVNNTTSDLRNCIKHLLEATTTKLDKMFCQTGFVPFPTTFQKALFKGNVQNLLQN